MSNFDGLAGLRAAPLPDLASQLLVRSFVAPGAAVQKKALDGSYTGILAMMFTLGGLEFKTAVRAARATDNDDFLQLTFECVLLWERAMLAARLVGGGEPRTEVILLRAGEQALAEPDPLPTVTSLLTGSILS